MDSFAALFGPEALYLSLLNLSPDCQKAIHEIEEALRCSSNPEVEISSLLSDTNWRPQLVGAVAAVLDGPKAVVAQALWRAFDGGSWVSPQLAVCAFYVDRDFSVQAKARIERGCPVSIGAPPRDLQEAVVRHVEAGPAGPQARSAKAMAALLYLCGLRQECESWLGVFEHDPSVRRLLEEDPDRGDEIAKGWKDELNRHGLPRQSQGQS